MSLIKSEKYSPQSVKYIHTLLHKLLPTLDIEDTK